ncbi:uncharacterized protein LOC128239013 [Mya arenaria]|uniref:uncharacterized protein LOC128239013 n=1 Tax=Mya arenaria TaxID=6604 RepID=UPI0022E70D26|nr:uncharacterized protein LOC128239013 [Mya arenaria]
MMSEKNLFRIGETVHNETHQAACDDVRPVHLYANISQQFKNTENGQRLNLLKVEPLETTVTDSERLVNVDQPGTLSGASVNLFTSNFYNHCLTVTKEDNANIELLDKMPGVTNGYVNALGAIQSEVFGSVDVMKEERRDISDDHSDTAQESSSIFSDLDIRPNSPSVTIHGFTDGTNEESDIEIKPELDNFLGINQGPAIDIKPNLQDLNDIHQEGCSANRAIQYLKSDPKPESTNSKAIFSIGMVRTLSEELQDVKPDIESEPRTQTSKVLTGCSGTPNIRYLLEQGIPSATKGNSTFKNQPTSIPFSEQRNLHSTAGHTGNRNVLVPTNQTSTALQQTAWSFQTCASLDGTVSPSVSCEETVKKEQSPLVSNDLLQEQHEPTRMPGPSIYLHSPHAIVSTRFTKQCPESNADRLPKKALPVSCQGAMMSHVGCVASFPETEASNVEDVSSASSGDSQIPGTSRIASRNINSARITRIDDIFTKGNASQQNLQRPKLLGYLLTSPRSTSTVHSARDPPKAVIEVTRSPKSDLRWVNPVSTLPTKSITSQLVSLGGNCTVQSNQVYTHKPCIKLARSAPCNVAISQPTSAVSHSYANSQTSCANSIQDTSSMLVEKDVSFRNPMKFFHRTHAIVSSPYSNNDNTETLQKTKQVGSESTGTVKQQQVTETNDKKQIPNATRKVAKSVEGIAKPSQLDKSKDICSSKVSLDQKKKTMGTNFASRLIKANAKETSTSIDFSIFRSPKIWKRGKLQMLNELNTSQVFFEDEVLFNVCIDYGHELALDWWFEESGEKHQSQVLKVDKFDKPDVLALLKNKVSSSEFQYVFSEVVYPGLFSSSSLISLFRMFHRKWFLVTENKHAVLLRKYITSRSWHVSKVFSYIKLSEDKVMVDCPGTIMQFPERGDLLEPLLIVERRAENNIQGGWRYNLHFASVKNSDFLQENWKRLSKLGLKKTMCPQVVSARDKGDSIRLIFLPVDKFHRPLVKGCCFMQNGCTKVYIVFVPVFSVFNCYSIVEKTYTVLSLIEDTGAVSRAIDGKTEDTSLEGVEVAFENSNENQVDLASAVHETLISSSDSCSDRETLQLLRKTLKTGPDIETSGLKVHQPVGRYFLSESKIDSTVTEGKSPKEFSSDNITDDVKCTPSRESTHEPNLYGFESHSEAERVKHTDNLLRRSSQNNASKGKNMSLKLTSQDALKENCHGFDIFRPHDISPWWLKPLDNYSTTSQVLEEADLLLSACVSGENDFALDWYYEVSNEKYRSHFLIVGAFFKPDVMAELMDKVPISEFQYAFSDILYPVTLDSFTSLHRLHERSWSLMTMNKSEMLLRQMMKLIKCRCRQVINCIKFDDNKIMVKAFKSCTKTVQRAKTVQLPSETQLTEPLLIIERRQDQEIKGGFRYDLHAASVKMSDCAREQWKQLQVPSCIKGKFCPQVVSAQDRDGNILLVFLPVDKYHRPLVEDCSFMQKGCFKVFVVLVPAFSVFSCHSVVVKTYVILNMIGSISQVTRAMNRDFNPTADKRMVEGVECILSDPKDSSTCESVFSRSNVCVNKKCSKETPNDTNNGASDGTVNTATISTFASDATDASNIDCDKKRFQMKCVVSLENIDSTIDTQRTKYDSNCGKKRRCTQGISNLASRKKARTGSDSD